MDPPSYDISPPQNRELHQLCWRFEPRLLCNDPPGPEEWLTQRGGIPADVVIREFLAIRAEFTSGPEQQNTATKLHSDVVSAWQAECLRLLPDQQDLVNGIFNDHRSAERNVSSEAESLESRLNDKRYQFVEEIDRGGTGAVWLVYDRHLRRETAVKVLLHSRISESSQQRLRQEARLCGRLSHPGIVPVYELGNFDDGRPFITMKLIRGQTLASRLKSLDPSEDCGELVQYILSACDAIGYAHANNIIHRDLKPANIMVGEFGEVQVMDWGLGKNLDRVTAATNEAEPAAAKPAAAKPAAAKPTAAGDAIRPTPNEITAPADEINLRVSGENQPVQAAVQLTRPITMTGTVFGTLAYMPPEQTQGDPALIDKRSDVFALGAILCETLTGKPPYLANSADELFEMASAAQLDEAFQRLDNAGQPDDLVELTKWCLSADPNHRPADAGRLAGLIRRFETVRVERIDAAEELDRQRQRNRLVKWYSAAIVAALLVSAFVGYKYLTEKNNRIADQANAERDHLQRQLLYGNRIRESIKTAREHSAIAAARPPHEQHLEWLLAVKEIEKAESYVDDASDEDLKKEFRLLAGDVQVNMTAAKRLHQRYLDDDKCRQELFRLIEQSYYPGELRLCRWVDLLPKFRETYARIGIEPGVISRSAVDRLQNSEFRSELIHGLMVWWRESRFQLSYGDGAAHSQQEIDDLGNWVTQLIDRADADPLRAQIRRSMHQRRFEEVVRLLNQDDAVSSLLTIHTVALCFSFPNIEVEDHLGFLLRAQQKFPQNFFVNWYLPAVAESSENKRSFALACYSLRPENPAVLSTLGQAYLADNKPHRAIETFNELVNVAPWSHLAHRNLASASQAVGDTENAAIQNKRADQLFTKVRDQFEQRINIARDMNRPSLAARLRRYLKELESAGVVVQEDAQLQPLSEDTLAQQAQLNQDIAERLKMLDRAPGNQGHHGKLGLYYSALCELLHQSDRPDLLQDALDRAIADFTKVAARAPTVLTPHERLSAICATYHRYEPAIESTKAAIAIHPGYAAQYHRLGEFYTALCLQHRTNREPDLFAQTVDRATTDLKQLSVESTKETPAAYEALARFCELHRQYADAVDALKRVVIVKPTSEHHRTKLGEMYVALGREHLLAKREEAGHEAFDSAIDILGKWVQDSPTNASAHEKLSEAYEYRGHFKAARKQLKIAIGLRPKHLHHQNRYAQLSVAESQQHGQGGHQSERIRFLKETLTFLESRGLEDDKLIPIHDELSDAYHQSGQYSQAIESLEKVIAHHPGDHALQERLAHLYVATGHPKQAAAIFGQLLKASPYDEQIIATVAKFHIQYKDFSEAKAVLDTAHAHGVTSAPLQQIRQSLTDRAVQ